MWFLRKLFLDPLGLPEERVIERGILSIPIFFDGALFDRVASDLSVEFPHHVRPVPRLRADGNHEGNLARLELHVFEDHFDVLLAATTGKCAGQLVSFQLEFESGLIRLALAIASVSHLPSPGGIDGWLPGSEGWAGDGQYQ